MREIVFYMPICSDILFHWHGINHHTLKSNQPNTSKVIKSKTVRSRGEGERYCADSVQKIIVVIFLGRWRTGGASKIPNYVMGMTENV